MQIGDIPVLSRVQNTTNQNQNYNDIYNSIPIGENKNKSRKSRSRSPTAKNVIPESPTDVGPVGSEETQPDPYLSSGRQILRNERKRNKQDERNEKKEKEKAKGEEKKEKKPKSKNSKVCSIQHHADEGPQLSHKEFLRIENNKSLLILYNFVKMVAGSDRRRYRKCGCVGSMPISHLWNMNEKDPSWNWREKNMTFANFEDSWSTYLTGAGIAAINSSLHIVRQCRNPVIEKVPLILLMSHKDLISPFQSLTTYLLQTSSDPINSQSVAKEAIIGTYDFESYLFRWFSSVNQRIESVNGIQRVTWYI